MSISDWSSDVCSSDLIRRADLPDETRESVYNRMRSEREREAAEFRAQGFEQAQRIKADADREATVIKAEAEREADILRGQGEGIRTEIHNKIGRAHV